MTKLKKVKFGLLGLGNVGREVIQQNLEGQHRFNFYWVADSRYLVSKANGDAFTRVEILAVIKAKKECPNQFGERCRSEILGCKVHEFENPTREAELVRELTAEPKENWIIIDTSTSPAEVDQIITRSALGCACYCTANKNPWASFDIFAELYREAERMHTLLGLNCVAGVWVDQMEILPILMQRLRSGQLEILKRDNSSLNLFFEKIGKGLSADRAIAEIAGSGHMEPGSRGLSVEVRDQILKANIAVNLCGIFRGISPSSVERSMSSEDPKGQLSTNPVDIANWHRSGRKRGAYPALVTRIRIEADTEKISSEVGFQELSRDHPLARDLGAKSAMSVQASEGAQFEWSSNAPRRRRMFVHSGYGGGSRTAAKLLWEAKRGIVLFNSCPLVNFSPLPVLWALNNNDVEVKRLEKKLAISL